MKVQLWSMQVRGAVLDPPPSQKKTVPGSLGEDDDELEEDDELEDEDISNSCKREGQTGERGEDVTKSDSGCRQPGPKNLSRRLRESPRRAITLPDEFFVIFNVVPGQFSDGSSLMSLRATTTEGFHEKNT